MRAKEEEKLEEPPTTARPKKQLDNSTYSLVLRGFQHETKQIQNTFNTQMTAFQHSFGSFRHSVNSQLDQLEIKLATVLDAIDKDEDIPTDILDAARQKQKQQSKPKFDPTLITSLISQSIHASDTHDQSKTKSNTDPSIDEPTCSSNVGSFSHRNTSTQEQEISSTYSDRGKSNPLSSDQIDAKRQEHEPSISAPPSSKSKASADSVSHSISGSDSKSKKEENETRLTESSQLIAMIDSSIEYMYSIPTRNKRL